MPIKRSLHRFQSRRLSLRPPIWDVLRDRVLFDRLSDANERGMRRALGPGANTVRNAARNPIRRPNSRILTSSHLDPSSKFPVSSCRHLSAGIPDPDSESEEMRCSSEPALIERAKVICSSDATLIRVRDAGRTAQQMPHRASGRARPLSCPSCWYRGACPLEGTDRHNELKAWNSYCDSCFRRDLWRRLVKGQALAGGGGLAGGWADRPVR